MVELEAGKAREASRREKEKSKSPEPEKGSRAGSDTETEMAPPPPRAPPRKEQPKEESVLLKPRPADSDVPRTVRQRHSQGDSSGYVSTDSEWEKVSEGGDKDL